MSIHIPDFHARFADRFIEEPMTGCWLWHASQTTSGYGNLTFQGASLYAHRAAFEAANGEGSAEGLVVRHRCDTPACVNPDHLRLGTPADNCHDAWSRGRMRPVRGERSGRAILSETEVLEARTLAKEGAPLCTIAGRFSAKRNAIEAAITGKSWSHLPGAVALTDIAKAPSAPPKARGEDVPNAKLSVDQVLEIRARLALGETGCRIAEAYGVSANTISAIKVGRNWPHVH